MRTLLTLWAACMLVLTASAVAGSVPVYVMLPLDVVNNQGNLTDANKLQGELQTLRSGGVDGIMVDCYWGLVEESRGEFNWWPYLEIARIASNEGLTMVPILSYHRCGGNVGDKCDIPLPQYVRDTASSNPDIWYTDASGNRDEEYIGLGVDHEPVFPGSQTAIDLYTNVASSFATAFSDFMRNGTIPAVAVSLGPAGELRYPSYQLDKWSFPGIGAFQCYDKYMMAMLGTAATKAGKSEWSQPPTNAGSYNSNPSNAPFFQDGQQNNYASDYGKFFLSWYSNALIQHGSDVLRAVRTALHGSGGNSAPAMLTKVAGVHWWYKTNSHPAEATAGYYNTNGANAYQNIANMLAKQGDTEFSFTCMEMRDRCTPEDLNMRLLRFGFVAPVQSSSAACGPEELVAQTMAAAMSANVPYGGENALPRYDTTAYSRIEDVARAAENQYGRDLAGFYYLRLGDELMQKDADFFSFVNTMSNL